MTDLYGALEANRAAVNELVTAAERVAERWTTPRAPGKWSPGQVVEHVARALEESANEVAGRRSRFPRFPAMLRPAVRLLVSDRVLRTGTIESGMFGHVSVEDYTRFQELHTRHHVKQME